LIAGDEKRPFGLFAECVMKALVYRGPGDKTVEDRPKPELQGLGEQHVRVTRENDTRQGHDEYQNYNGSRCAEAGAKDLMLPSKSVIARS
jgi:hypothetical protein